MDIDLIFCCDYCRDQNCVEGCHHNYSSSPNMAFDFVELKIKSNNPLYAAIQILIYGLFYVFSRVNAVDLGYSVKKLPVLKAKKVNLCVLAPTNFYYYKNKGTEHSYNLEWLAKSLDRGIQKLAEYKLHDDPVTMGFRFEALRPEDFEPSDAKEITQKDRKQRPEWVYERHL